MGCQEKDVPWGIVDEEHGAWHITFGSSSKTRDCIVDTIATKWEAIAEQEQAETSLLQMKMANGPESRGRRTPCLYPDLPPPGGKERKACTKIYVPVLSRWEHGIVTAAVVTDSHLSGVLTSPIALQLRWQYAQRSRSDYRAHETVSAMTAQTSVELAEQIIANVEGYLHAQHP
jgi:hypothetical protein